MRLGNEVTHRTRWARLVLGLLIVAFGLVALRLLPAGAAAQPEGYVDEWVMDLPELSVAAEWLPDGRLLVLTRDGKVHIVDRAQRSSSLVLTMENVSRVGERGALDLALHPNFANSGKFFVYHATADQPAELRIVRFTLDEGDPEATAGSIAQIWQNPGPDHVNEFHIGGSLEISADHRLLLTVGDGQTPAQSGRLDNVFGKVMRLNLNGSIPQDNPFVDDPDALDEIYAYGLRNPFRSWVEPATGTFWVGDVGSGGLDAFEEINQVVAAGDYGWPACEGPIEESETCPTESRTPWHSYRHDTAEPCCANGSIVAGERYTGSLLPEAVRGSFLFGDWSENTISWVGVDATGAAGSVGVIPVIDDAKPVWISVGPDDFVYYIRHSPFDGPTYELRRIGYDATDQAPVIDSIDASPSNGPAPLIVEFTAEVVDPNGDELDYLWDFGDGITSNVPEPRHVYATEGNYEVTLAVTANGVSASAGPILVQAGGVPTVRITSPADGARFVAGERLTLAAEGTDEAPLAGASYSWDLGFVHGNHEHETAVDGATGNPFVFVVPTTGHDFSGETGYEITVTVTDADGLTATDSVSLMPEKVELILTSDVPGGSILVDGVAHAAPYALDTIVGFEHAFRIPESTCVYNVIAPSHDAVYLMTQAQRGSCGDLEPIPPSTCHGRAVTVDLSRGELPTEGDDVILGTPQRDVIDALGGNDRVCALGGADVVVGGPGRDRIDGGRGADRLYGGDARDVIIARAGADWVDGGRGRDRISGNQGDDVLRGGPGHDTVVAADGDDWVRGGAGLDQLVGGPGIDFADGGADVDSCTGFESTLRCG